MYGSCKAKRGDIRKIQKHECIPCHREGKERQRKEARERELSGLKDRSQ